MSSYFDNAQREIRELNALNDLEFLKAAAEIENKVVKDCLLNSGDREFPDDLRQKIVGHVAVFTLGYESMQPTEKGLNWIKVMRYSKLIELLHNDFHEVAQRRYNTRFGLWSDQPNSNLARRDAYDAEKAVKA